MDWGTFKTTHTDALIEHLHPIQVRRPQELQSDNVQVFHFHVGLVWFSVIFP